MCISLFSYGRPVVVRCMGVRLGMGWVGSMKIDPRTTLWQCISQGDAVHLAWLFFVDLCNSKHMRVCRGHWSKWCSSNTTKTTDYYNNKKLSWCWETLREAISSGGRKSIGKYFAAVYRRNVCGGSKRIGRPHRRTALPLLSVFIKPKYSKFHPSDRFPFPLEFRNNNAVLENHNGSATRPRKSLAV